MSELAGVQRFRHDCRSSTFAVWFNSLILCRSGQLADRLEWFENWKLWGKPDGSCATISRELQASPCSSRGRRSRLKSKDATSPLAVQTYLSSEAFEACKLSEPPCADPDHQLATRLSCPA